MSAIAIMMGSTILTYFFRNSDALTYPLLSFSAWWSAQRPPRPPWYQAKGCFKGTIRGIQNKHWSKGKHLNGFLTKIPVWFQLPKEASHWSIPIWVFSYTKFSLPLHEGALATLFIVRKIPQDPHTAPQLACHPLNNERGKRSSLPQTRRGLSIQSQLCRHASI